MDCCTGARHGFLSLCRTDKKLPGFDIYVARTAARPHRQATATASMKNEEGKVFRKKHGVSSFPSPHGLDRRPSPSGTPASLHVNTISTRKATATSSTKNEEGEVFRKKHGVSSFPSPHGLDRRPSSSGTPASLHVNTISTDSDRHSENEVMPPAASGNDCDSSSFSERKRSRNAVTQLPGSVTLSSDSRTEISMESSSTSTVIASDNRRVVHARDANLVNEIENSSWTSSDAAGSTESDEQTTKEALPETLADELKKPGPLKEIQDHISGEIESSPSRDSDSSLSHLLASKNALEFIFRFPSWADSQKESGMPQRQRRSFYSHDDWRRHRSSIRYIRHVLSSVSSRVIVSLVPPVFTFTTVAIIVALYNTALKYGYLPLFLPKLHAASLPYELTAPALALLLVFRTDASYSRYNEARKAWTSIISSTKDLARLSSQLIRKPQDMELKSSLLSYILAFPVSLKCHLLHGSDTLSELESLLNPYDLAFVLSSEHRPNCLIQLISQALVLLHLEDADRVLLENHVQQYVASVSVCERLVYTRIPLSYTRLTSRFLVLWHMTLPVVLWDACDWLAIPATFFSASTLFCIEEVGVLIEEPFPMLTLDKMIGLAHDSIRELLKRQQETDQFLSLKRSK